MRILVLITIFLVFSSHQSSGQETEDPLREAVEAHSEAAAKADQDDLNQAITDLEDMVITAGRVEESAFETAGSISRIDGRSLDNKKVPATFPDALRRLPGVAIQKTGPGLGSPFIRGFTGFRTALTVDGIRINHSAFRDGPNQYWATVDALGLDRIEVLNGPAGVLHGSDAAGGVVAAFTEPVLLGEEGAPAEVAGRVYYRFNSAENSHIARSEFGVGHGGVFGAQVGLTFKSFGETNAGGDLGRQEGLSYDAYLLNAKFQYLPSDDVSLEFLVQSVHLNNVPRIHSTQDGVSFHGTTIGSDRRREFDQDRDLVALTATIYDGSFFEEAIFKAGYQQQTEVQDRIRSSGRRDRSGFDLDTFFATAQFHSPSSVGRLVYGVDLYIDWVDSFSTRFVPSTGMLTKFAQGPVGDGAQYLTFGAYIEDTVELGTWGKLSFGARYTHVNAQADTVFDPISSTIFDLDESFDAVVGSTKLLVKATKNLRVYGSANMGFRAPNLSDLTRFDSARSNEIEVPSTDLDSEYFLGLELGGNWRSKDLRVHGALFYTFLFDSIVRRPTGDIIGGEVAITKSNAGDGHILGTEFSVAWDINEEFTLSGQFTWLDGQVDTFPTSAANVEAESISRLAPIQGLVALDFHPLDCGLTMSAEVELVDRADRLNTRDKADTQRIPSNGTPGYVVFNLRTNYAFDQKKSVFLHLENIGDKNYRVHGSGSQEAGFAAIVGFDLRF